MNKNDLKKLALMGITGGLMLTTQGAEATSVETTNSNMLGNLLAGGCGSKCGGHRGSCGSSSGNEGQQPSSCGGKGRLTADRGCGAGKCGGARNHSCSGSNASESEGQQPSSCGSKGRLTADRGCGAGKCGGARNHSCSGSNASENEGQQPSSCGSKGRLTADRGCGAGKCGSAHYHSCSGSNGNDSGSNDSDYEGQQASSCGAHSGKGGALTAEVEQKAEHSFSSKSDVKKELTETELLSNLNAEGKALYNQLTPEGKKLALKLATQACKGHNTCKGLNSCKTKEHECAGKGGCKGTSQCSFKDKNQAVKVAAQKMAEKRASLNKSHKNQNITQAENTNPSTGNPDVLHQNVDTLENQPNVKSDNQFQNNRTNANQNSYPNNVYKTPNNTNNIPNSGKNPINNGK